MSINEDFENVDLIREKMADAMTPGYEAEFDPEEAERAGAFIEDALTEDDATASAEDLSAAFAEDEPAFLDDGPSTEIPPFITTTNARELYGLRDGETVTAAIDRTAKEG